MGTDKEFYGNILGDARAENDYRMLKSVFVETSDYHALIKTKDFNFIVGRRGTGKSALYLMTSKYFRTQKNHRVYRLAPEEYDNLALQSTLSKLTKDYQQARYITRIAWQITILIEIANDLCKYYRFKRCSEKDFLQSYTAQFNDICKQNHTSRMQEIIKTASNSVDDVKEIPSKIAKKFQVRLLEDAIKKSLHDIKCKAIVLVDKLDEGWLPDKISASVIGGLALCSGKISESESDIHIYSFLRDNIFRVLSRFDKDFSRDIESTTLRLRWDTDSLYTFITNRIKTSFALDDKMESTTKIWNRFAHTNIKNRSGFISCLNKTLFRPRDLLVLLNNAFLLASRSGRNAIVESDVESAAINISTTRLLDLLKEYDEVLPGLELLISQFKGENAVTTFDEIILFLDEVISEEQYLTQNSSDFALLDSGTEAFKALYGIGFIGAEMDSDKQFVFSFDGSPVKFDNLGSATTICIHPCYWRALDLKGIEFHQDVLQEIFDDYTVYRKPELAEERKRIIGDLVAELPSMPEGHEGAHKFEQWCLRAVKILFAGALINPELHPNKDAIQRRDIVATNSANTGFWKRIFDDYDSRQVVFEIKNFSEMEQDIYRQALSYAGDMYGHFIILVNRSEKEALTEKEKGWLKETYSNQGKVLVFTLPANILARCISKLRSRHRFDYTDKILGKRLDTFQRNYLSLRHNKQ